MSEMLLLFTTLLMTLQSTFWCSLLTIPLSILSIFITRQVLEFSGLVVFIFCLVFIGGLLLLIVMVSTLSHQESSLIIDKMSMIAVYMMSYFFLLKVSDIDFSNKVSAMFWYEKTPLMISLPLMSLFISLMTISFFLSNSKMMSRVV
uniref:NADH dehydrogenase subunit 6 n=1 Tax=Xiphinema americanum TaxID=208518 RepID=Q6TY90_XIPAM|nr:NADH dehydrogenase subunit 6 [Xiphinema americanum]AAQ75782.1 NADH dehydrogenase subunit 6 [Xiphinema americanum]